MDEPSPKTLKNWALFRFSVVGGLLARPPEKGELANFTPFFHHLF